MRLVAALVVCLAANLAYATPEGACKKDDLVSLRKALASISEEMRAVLLVQGLTEACERALPPGVVQGLYAIPKVDPADRTLIVAALLSENVSFATAACPSFAKVFAEVAKVEPADKAALLYRGCKYDALGVATEKEYLAAAKSNFAVAMLAPAYYKWLVDNKMDKDAARRWARDLLGLK